MAQIDTIARALVDSAGFQFALFDDDIEDVARMIAETLRAAVAAEREACAKVVDDRRALCQAWEDVHLLEDAAAAIRARSAATQRGCAL